MQIRQRAVDAWLDDIRAGWGERAHRAAAAVSHHLTSGDAAGLQAAGEHLAQSGFTLDELLSWVRLLARRSRAMRSLLHDDGIARIAAGWADGVLSAEFGVTRAAPLEVLRLRIHQQSALAEREGQHAGRLALVVVEVTGSPTLADPVLQVARSEFAAGESMAVAPNGRVLILVRRGDTLCERTRALSTALHSQPGLRGVTVRVWVEPLGMSAEHVDSHLLGLAS